MMDLFYLYGLVFLFFRFRVLIYFRQFTRGAQAMKTNDLLSVIPSSEQSFSFIFINILELIGVLWTFSGIIVSDEKLIFAFFIFYELINTAISWFFRKSIGEIYTVISTLIQIGFAIIILYNHFSYLFN